MTEETLATEETALPGVDADLEAAWAELHNEPSRDDRGRFAGKQEDTPAVEEAPAEEMPVQGTEEAAVEAETPIAPPSSWTAEAKTIFAALPPETQKYLAQRESERESFLNQKSQEAAQLKQRYEPLESILTPRRSQWQAEGMTESQALQQLLTLSDFASNDPKGFIEWFSQQRGVNMSAPQSDQQGNPPELTQYIAPIVQKVQAIENQLQATQEREAIAEVEAFKATAPHFEDVKQEMLVLIPALKQMNPGMTKQALLKQAYDKAIWANDTVRERILTEQQLAKDAKQQAAEAKKLEEQKQAAAKARKAAGTQLSGNSIAATAAKAVSEAELMESVWDKLHGAA